LKPAVESDPSGLVVVLGTGGTIAGTAASAGDNVGYRSAQRGVELLVAGLGGAAGSLETEQVAQLDSKDMDFAVWQRLAERVAHHAARAEVAGVVVTHGTDTLEETAYFLHRVLAPRKPVVLTGAMRPASALQADGPQNLRDAVAVARLAGARGVLVAMAGTLHRGVDVRKLHPYRLDAFSSGDAGPLGRLEEGQLRQLRDWPPADPVGLDRLPADPSDWPRVAIVTSAAGSGGWIVDALRGAGVRGIVVAATGNGTIHHALEAPLREAVARGCAVLRATRCIAGSIREPVLAPADALPAAGALTPQQARVELIVRLLERRAAPT